MFLIQKAQNLKSRCWSGSILSTDSGGDPSSTLLSSHSCWQVSGFYAGVPHAFELSLLSVLTQPTASCLQFQISLFFIRHQSLDRGPPPCAVALPYFDHIIYKCALQIRSHFEVPGVSTSTHLSVDHISPITVAGNGQPFLATYASR